MTPEMNNNNEVVQLHDNPTAEEILAAFTGESVEKKDKVTSTLNSANTESKMNNPPKEVQDAITKQWESMNEFSSYENAILEKTRNWEELTNEEKSFTMFDASNDFKKAWDTAQSEYQAWKITGQQNTKSYKSEWGVPMPSKRVETYNKDGSPNETDKKIVGSLTKHMEKNTPTETVYNTKFMNLVERKQVKDQAKQNGDMIRYGKNEKWDNTITVQKKLG